MRLAVSVAVWLALILPACTENEALADPAGTITETGTVSGAALAKRIITVAPPLGAAADNVTVQVAVACAASVVGLHANVLTVGGGVDGGGGGGGAVNWSTKLCELPFKFATSVAVVEALTAATVALNAAEVAPWPMGTEAGILTLAVVFETPRPTLSPPLGAAADVVTVHDTLPGVVRGFGEQASAVNVTGGGGGAVNWSTKLSELPFSVPTNVAVVEALTAEIVAPNTAVVAPCAMLTEPGILTLAVVFESPRPTLSPPLGAAADVVTVHDTLPGVVRGLGEQAKAVNVTGGGGGGASWRPKLCELPFHVATNVAVVEALTAEIAALNVAVVAPCAMVTELGTVTLAVLPETPSATLNPPLGAGADAVTVHDAVAGVVRGLGEQDNAVNVTGWVIVTVPPVAVTASGLPKASVAVGLVIWMAEDLFVVVDESVRVMVATTPLLIVFSFSPKSRQLIDPAPVPQETDLLAAVAAGPAATLKVVKSTVE